MTGRISQIETMGLVDGPGVRIVIFMQGCPLRCIFCHNPDMWSVDGGNKSTPKEVLNIILKYKNYYGEDGGVTFSGGEPLLQEEFLLECLKLCKKNKINTCIDTCGVYKSDLYKKILKYTDLVLYSVKALDNKEYKKITDSTIDKSLEFLRYCSNNNIDLWIRNVIVPGINDNMDYINNLYEFLKPFNIKKIELLPYHTLGITKYNKLGIKYSLNGIKPMDTDKCKELEKVLLERMGLWKKEL